MLLKAPPSVLNNHHFTEKVALVFVHRFKVNPSSSKSSSEQETIPTHNKIDLNKKFQVKLLYFLCWKFHPLLWSFQEELDLGAVIWVLITQQARSSCSFRDQGGSYSVETYSDDYFKRAMTLRWAVSQPPSIVRNWKLMVRRRMGGQQQPTYQSLSDVCFFGPASCDGTERVCSPWRQEAGYLSGRHVIIKRICGGYVNRTQCLS